MKCLNATIVSFQQELSTLENKKASIVAELQSVSERLPRAASDLTKKLDQVEQVQGAYEEVSQLLTTARLELQDLQYV